MPVWLRRTLIAAGLLLALLAAGAAWFVARFDANRYKGLLVERVQAQYGRTLAIDGPIGLALFPRLQLTLRDVKLSEPRRADDEFMALQEASLSVQLLPLLRQRLAVDRVGARGVRLVYSRDAQGRRNIDDLLAKPTETAPDAPSGRALGFDVRGIELADLQLSVRDVLAGIDGRVEVERLATGRLADGAESPVSLQARAQLTKPALDARLALDGLLKLDLPPGAPARIGLRELTLALRGAGFGVKELDARLTGALRLDGSALAAERLALTLSGERLGLALKDSRLALASLAHDPGKRTLKLEGLELQLAGRRGAEALAATLAWPRLDVSGDTLKGGALQGSASLKSSAQTLQLAFASQAPSGSFERIRVPGLKVQVSGSAGPRAVKGEVRSDLTLATAPFSAALDALALQLAFTDPALPPTALALKGSARASAAAANWAVEGTLNEQAFSSSGKADLDRPVPKVDAQARFAALDLTRFVKPAEAPAAQQGGAPAAAADAPLDLSGLKALDGSFTLRAGTLVYPPYRVADAALDATLAGGTLRVSQLAGRAWGGRFTAQASAQAAARPQEQRASVRLDASDVDIAALLKDVAKFEKLEGRGQVSADLRTQGASVGQFRKQLGGNAAIRLRDGAVRGINLAKTLRQWRSAVTLNKDAVQKSSAQEKTDFSEITATFQVADGVARNQDLSAKSPFLRVGGEGAIDIGQGRIDYLAKATVTATPEGQDGAELAGLKGVTVPVKLAGPFEAVDYRIQWGAVAGELLKKRAAEAIGGKTGAGLLEKLTGRAPAAASAPAGAASAPATNKKDSTKDRLKELFGR
ncbi:MAG TPA: AsmA family protein [Methylibium sp.]|nr:AsmA family protein [Methylibium sp.]